MPEFEDSISMKDLNRAARILMAAAADLGYPDPHAFAEKYANMLPLNFGMNVMQRIADGDLTVISVAVKLCCVIEDPGVREEMIEEYEDARAKAYAQAAAMGLTHEDIRRMSEDDEGDEDDE